MPDLRRHIRAHTAKAQKDWICCGVPVQLARKYKVDRRTVASSTRYWAETGMMMVGGCAISFARRDAYRRHLKDCKVKCVGDAEGYWVPGNARKEAEKL